jgi:ribonucleotide reductase beta subunit family protein with ferritin-like domain
MLVMSTCTRYDGIWEFYKKAVASFWTVEEVDLSQDLKDWSRLTGGDKPSRILYSHPSTYLISCALLVPS